MNILKRGERVLSLIVPGCTRIETHTLHLIAQSLRVSVCAIGMQMHMTGKTWVNEHGFPIKTQKPTLSLA